MLEEDGSTVLWPKPSGSVRDPRPIMTQLQARTWNNFMETTGLLETRGRHRTFILVLLDRSGMWHLMGEIFGGYGWNGLQRGFRRWLWATTHWCSHRVLSCGVQGALCSPPSCLLWAHLETSCDVSTRLFHYADEASSSRSPTDTGLLLRTNAKHSLRDCKCEI